MLAAAFQAPALASAIQDEIGTNWQRWRRWTDAFLSDATDPPMAQTPRELIWKRGKIRLYRYLQQTETQHPLPYFIVPWLGISRPYILDLLPGQSMIEYLVQQGHDVYMLDWGVIAAEDKDLGLEDIVFQILPRAIDEILHCSGTLQLNLNGLCLGGVISNCYLSLHPNAPVKNYVSIVTPVDFDQGGCLKAGWATSISRAICWLSSLAASRPT